MTTSPTSRLRRATAPKLSLRSMLAMTLQCTAAVGGCALLHMFVAG